MYEGRNAQMFQTTTGVITWMSNPAQPSFVWQLYHHDLDPNSSLYAVQKAAEPIHIQLNEQTGVAQIVNNSASALTQLTARSTLFRLDGSEASTKSYPVASVPASTTAAVAKVEIPQDISPVYFVRLDLSDAAGSLLSTNFYWQSTTQDDFAALQAMPPVTLDASGTSRVQGDQTILQVDLKNNTSAVALMTHLQLHRGKSDERVLPAFYSENYLSLAPGESRRITIETATKDLKAEPPVVELDGFNVTVEALNSRLAIRDNRNAQPAHWPASAIVP